jgi:ABC-type glycerol-3-phosphate transport system substrate-binding protein
MTAQRPASAQRAKSGKRSWLHGPIASMAVLLSATLAVSACSPPGSDTLADTVDPASVSTELPDEQIELTLYDGAGLKAIDEALIAAFEEKYPNVTINTRFDPDDVQAQNAPRVLASNNPPDIARINALADIVSNGQLTNLDPWAEAYGWTDLPEGQLAMYRVNEDGVRGTGPQYSLASGFVLTGLYYNKEIAERLDIGEPPSTIEELEENLAKAKATGVTPIMAGNQTGQVAFAVQSMMNNEMGRQPINDWVFNEPGATIDNAEALAAVERVAEWAEKGYLNEDTNGTDSTAALGRFIRGESLYFFSGSWDAPALDDQMGDNVGFVLAPAGQQGLPLGMSDPVSNFAIPARSKNKNAAAAFLNFLTSPEARQIIADTGAGPSGTGELPESEPGSVKAEVLQGFATLVEADGQVQFVQNATSGINAAWVSQTQQLVAGRVTPQEYLNAIQSSYQEHLRR